MDREKAAEVLSAFGRPAFKTENTIITFARQDQSSVDAIEAMDTEELIKQWKSLVWVNYIYGQVSLNEMQRISLIELEFDSRGVDSAELSEWYETQSDKFNESQEEI